MRNGTNPFTSDRARRELGWLPKVHPRESIPEDIGIAHCETVGHYGIRFDWTDGHTTGIYTWERLRSLGAS